MGKHAVLALLSSNCWWASRSSGEAMPRACSLGFPAGWPRDLEEFRGGSKGRAASPI